MSFNTHSPLNKAPLLPLTAMMWATGLSLPMAVQAQDLMRSDATLPTVTVKGETDSPTESKEKLLVKRSGIAKGHQSIKDIPQTVTVMTEKLMDDRNLDDFREVLKTTAGVTFLAGETGEEDVRIRGFSLQQSGDIYVDGLRDAPLRERDTFNLDRVEVLKGSASMLFGKGSTGGVVNQVNKQPFLMDQSEVNLMTGSGQMHRATVDLNRSTGESSAFRLNAMTHHADNWGATSDKQGIAPSFRWGIGERHEFNLSFYHLKTEGRPLYAHPWMVDNGSTINGGPRNSGANNAGTLVAVLDPHHYYGMASDHLRTETSQITFTHTARLATQSELKTTLRVGHYSRDLLGSQVGFKNLTQLNALSDATLLSRRAKARYGDSDVMQVQSDYTHGFETWGHRHQLIAGIDGLSESAQRNNNHTTGLTNPDIAVGSPDNGVGINDPRVLAPNLFFSSQTLGVYAQDTVQVTPEVKALSGLRLEQFSANYRDVEGYVVSKQDWLLSPRLGVLWQPDASTTHYVSWGTSYNTSGDTYAYAVGTSLAPGAANVTTLNTPPEMSRNLEFGSKWEIQDGKGLLGVALFNARKYNERNTDVDSAANQYLLSGERHANGMEFNYAGQPAPTWEVFFNHTWIPDARIDVSSATGSMKAGDRPGLTPVHSGSFWTTKRLNGLWRVGVGLNYRGEQTPLTSSLIKTQAFTTWDGMLEYTLNEQNLIKLNVTNLTNQVYIDQVYTSFYIPGTPRRLELSLKTLF